MRVDTIPDWVAAYRGVPHVSHGRTPAAWDCWGLFRWCLENHFGIVLPSYAERYAHSDAAPEIAALIAGETGAWRALRAPLEGGERVRPGDGVLMRKGRHACHVGLAIDRRNMLHADSGIDIGTDVEPFDGLVWRDRVVGIYRHPALEVR